MSSHLIFEAEHSRPGDVLKSAEPADDSQDCPGNGASQFRCHLESQEAAGEGAGSDSSKIAHTSHGSRGAQDGKWGEWAPVMRKVPVHLA